MWWQLNHIYYYHYYYRSNYLFIFYARFALQTGISYFSVCWCFIENFNRSKLIIYQIEMLASICTDRIQNLKAKRVNGVHTLDTVHCSAYNKLLFKRHHITDSDSIEQFWNMPVPSKRSSILRFFHVQNCCFTSVFFSCFVFSLRVDAFCLCRICAICISSGDSISVEKWQSFLLFVSYRSLHCVSLFPAPSSSFSLYRTLYISMFLLYCTIEFECPNILQWPH